MDIWTERRSSNANVRPNDHREPYQRDKARILHSAAFRRLQAKTQILGVGHDDFYRTRLTHSLEVAQIGSGLLAQIKFANHDFDKQTITSIIPHESLVESLCLAHDIGHPPFGHGGEVALNYLMHKSGGFEGNGQTLRIVSKLEQYTETFGMDLTRRTMLGLIKYPQFIRSNRDFQQSNSPIETSPFINANQWKPVKGIFGTEQEEFNWILSGLKEEDRLLFQQQRIEADLNNTMSPYHVTKSLYKSFDASLMELADDIAYGVHDLEDAIVLGNVNQHQWNENVLEALLQINNPWARKHAEQLSNMLFSDAPYERKNAIGALVNHLITSCEIQIQHPKFQEPLLKFKVGLNEMAQAVLVLLKRFVFEYVIKTTEIQRTEFKGQEMLIQTYLALISDPERLLPTKIAHQFKSLGSEQLQKRFVCDYLADMSDVQATRTFNSLFSHS